MSAAAATPATLTKVFVGNLAFQTTDEELKEAFSGAGAVFVVKDPSRIFVF
jgi:RNA recognition motif-containing protein